MLKAGALRRQNPAIQQRVCLLNRLCWGSETSGDTRQKMFDRRQQERFGEAQTMYALIVAKFQGGHNAPAVSQFEGIIPQWLNRLRKNLRHRTKSVESVPPGLKPSPILGLLRHD
jgi:hypothetical protein